MVSRRFGLVVGWLLLGGAPVSVLGGLLAALNGLGAVALLVGVLSALVAASLAANLFLLASIDRRLEDSPGRSVPPGYSSRRSRTA